MPNEDVNNEVTDVPSVITGTIEMEDGGVITFELYPDVAPETVRNFVYLARQGFYDGVVFHRIIQGFMIQGGCPLGAGTGGPGYTIFGETSNNGFENNLLHERGIMSMANSGHPDSGGSQFFILDADAPWLDGAHATFGFVTSGMDVVDRLAETPVLDGNGTVAPENMPVMRTITIDGDFEMDPPNKLGR
ncbi:MAG: peptidylprolyl isomerase [Oscillospiraceae bacterium]|nr:peptidylprolyl isomerase [Oscillospiraceae bacterium]